RGAAALPALDPVDVVPVEPLRIALRADVVRDVRDVVAAERTARLRHGLEGSLELPLLGAEEPDAAGEEARVAAVADHDLDLALLVATETADDAELEQELLHVTREPLAIRRVGDLDAVTRQQRRRAVSGEERAEELALERKRSAPDKTGHLLLATGGDAK